MLLPLSLLGTSQELQDAVLYYTGKSLLNQYCGVVLCVVGDSGSWENWVEKDTHLPACTFVNTAKSK